MANCYPPQASFTGPNWLPQNQSCVRSSTFRDMMQPFPRPRNTSRVTKPRSAGNSPSSAGRRRTTTIAHSSPMYQPFTNLDYQVSLNAALLETALQGGRRSSRPMSWHPVSMEQTDFLTSQSQYYPPCTASENLAVMPLCSQSLHETASTPNDSTSLQTFAPAEIPVSQPTFSLHSLQDHLPMPEPPFLQVSGPNVDASWDVLPSGLPTFTQPISDTWSLDMTSMNQSIPSVGVAGSSYESVSSPGPLTEPPTPDFLPIQQFDDQGDSYVSPFKKDDGEDELVGMGLYSHPDTFTESALYGLTGKGLKLEETFTPSADDEAEADENDADSDDDDQEESQITQPISHKPAHSQVQLNSQYEPYKQPSKPMMKSSFFETDEPLEQYAVVEPRPPFNLGATSCMNYGYGWI